jgi:hypothetical protein
VIDLRPAPPTLRNLQDQRQAPQQTAKDMGSNKDGVPLVSESSIDASRILGHSNDHEFASFPKKYKLSYVRRSNTTSRCVSTEGRAVTTEERGSVFNQVFRSSLLSPFPHDQRYIRHFFERPGMMKWRPYLRDHVQVYD